MNKKGDASLNALPYYDTLINDKDVKTRVEALVEAECATYRRAHDKLCNCKKIL